MRIYIILGAAAWAAVVAAAYVSSGPEAALWACGGGAAVLVVAVWAYLQKRREISQLSELIDQVLHEGRSIDFSNCAEGEVAVLRNEMAKVLNKLDRTSAQLEQERNALSDALADVSHQIRTPLTAMSLMVAAIQQCDDAGEQRRLIRNLEQQVDRVSWLVTTLLKIAKVDAGALKLQHQRVSVADCVRQAVAPLEVAMDLHDVQLVVEGEREAAFEGDAAWTVEALTNILKNCIEHTPNGGMISVRVVEDAVATRIVVVDSGSGFSAEDLPHVFDRFYRGSQSEDNPAQMAGFGIGLSLAQSLVTAQGGTLRADNAPAAGGARFTITFPKLCV